MRKAWEWLDHHLWAYALLIWAVGTGAGVLVSPRGSLLGAAVRAVGITAVAIGIVAYRRKHDSRAIGTGESALISRDRQLQRGEVPQDAAGREEMGRLVAKRRHTTRHMKWVLPLWCLMMGGIGVLMLVAPPSPRFIWVGVAIFVFVAWFLWLALRTRARLDAMEKALGRAPADGATRHAGRV